MERTARITLNIEEYEKLLSERREAINQLNEIYGVISGYRAESWFPKDTMKEIEQTLNNLR